MRILLFRIKFYLGRTRWRIRVRAIRPRRWWHRLTEAFSEGTVHRLWIGPLLFIAMVDDAQ